MSGPTPSPSAGTAPNSGDVSSSYDKYLAAAAQVAGQGGGGNNKVPGFPSASADRKIFAGYSGGPQGTNVYTTLKDYYDKFYGMSDAQVKSLAQKLYQAGLIPSANQDRATIWQAWSAVINEAGSMADSGNLVSPYMRLAAYMEHPLDLGGQQPLKPYDTTAKSVNFTDPKQAKAILTQSLQDSIGRAPSPAETQAFMAALHASESENPTVTKTSYSPNSNGTSYDTSSTSSGGVDAGAFSTDYSQGHNQVEHASYQASTTYMNALMQAIGATVG